MDKQGRLTQWHEWQVGETYQWLKGGKPGPTLRCAAVDRKEGCIKFATDEADGRLTVAYNWRNRYRRHETARQPA